MTITQFMWAYQPHFCSHVEVAAKMAFEAIGFDDKLEVILIGFQAAGDHEFEVCIEPETGPHAPADFAGIVERAKELYNQHPDRHTFYSNEILHAEKQQELRDKMRAQAVVETLENHPAGMGKKYFASRSTRVDDYEVHTILSVSAERLQAVPRLVTTSRDRFEITPSLVHAVIRDILDHAASDLHLPNPGHRLGISNCEPSEVMRRASTRLVASVFFCAGHYFGQNADSLLNAISALPYEGRAGIGRLVLAKPDDKNVEILIRMSQPVKLDDTRAVRKLMEASSSEVGLLVGDGNVSGFGSVKTTYNPTLETVFVVSVLGRGAWDLYHDKQVLLSVRDGAAHLPVHVLNEDELRDRVERLIPNADVEALISVVHSAGRHEHGAMVVISADAAVEADRLAPQAWKIQPVRLSSDMLSQLTAMDGAILVDGQGSCHALGVILDGQAVGEGDPSRGSRFNNAVRYLNTNPCPAVVIVYSSDGTIDILPRLHLRVRKRDVVHAVQRYLELASARPPDLPKLAPAWDRVRSYRFYLSEGQCSQINEARKAIEEWRFNNDGLSPVEQDFAPDPAMNSSYWLD